MEIAIGIALLLLGVLGANAVQRFGQERGIGWWNPILTAPMGLLIGAGAALIRGWDLVPTMLAGLIVLPAATIVARLIQTRRERRRDL